MNNRKLIILSGGGDPENEKYKKVYNVILGFAKKLNYEETLIKGWKGQHSYSEDGFINMGEATESAISLFNETEEQDVSYDVICRSFGTGVFLNICQKIDLRNIGFATLWGMPSYTTFYKLYKENILSESELSKNKGLNIDETFFESVIPFELLLGRFNRNFRVNFVSGSEDVVCTPAFNDFLKQSIKNNNIQFSIITGLPHEVPYYHQEYLEKIFSIL